MIAQLTGVVAQVGPTSAVIEIGGFGVQAVCSPNTVAGLRLGQRATLATSLVVREDSLTLYGFASADEREFLFRSGHEAGTAFFAAHPSGRNALGELPDMRR